MGDLKALRLGCGEALLAAGKTEDGVEDDSKNQPQSAKHEQNSLILSLSHQAAWIGSARGACDEKIEF